MPETLEDHLLTGPLGVRMAPEAEVPITVLYSQSQGDIHIFLPENTTMNLVNYVANKFSRRVEQPVKVFHDEGRKKYRLCPIPEGIAPDMSTYGRYCFTRVSENNPVVGENGERIPHPRSCFDLYRQAKSPEIIGANEGITASELSSVLGRSWDGETGDVHAYWENLAAEEARNHKLLYPGYDPSSMAVSKHEKS
ncbi:hypothetical protein FGRMN_1490 [Fusarium graminum]|nr:hypothetical protein FGRMN_1490 [Fusarium graminum]